MGCHCLLRPLLHRNSKKQAETIWTNFVRTLKNIQKLTATKKMLNQEKNFIMVEKLEGIYTCPTLSPLLQFLKDCRLFPAWEQSWSLVPEQTLSTNYCVCSKLSGSSLKDCCKAFIFGLTQSSSSIKKQQLVLESITMWTKKSCSYLGQKILI